MRKLTTALAALTLLIAGYVLAQTTPLFTKPSEQTVAVAKQAPQTMQLNENLAIRIEGTHDGRVFGTLLTKVNGKWVEVILASKNMRATND